MGRFVGTYSHSFTEMFSTPLAVRRVNHTNDNAARYRSRALTPVHVQNGYTAEMRNTDETKTN